MAESMSEWIGTCVICDEPIYEEDDHYELPYGDMVCNNDDCVEEWLRDYFRYGATSLI